MDVQIKDILTVDRGVIVHQVNLRCVMGAGLAKSIALKWSIVKDRYVARCKYASLGMVQFVEVGDGLWVANLFAQDGYGGGVKHTDYQAVGQGLDAVKIFAESQGLEIYIPHGMGAGLGGGEWWVIDGIIQNKTPNAIVCLLP